MRELLNFFIRNSKWFVFIILVVLSTILLVRSNPLHQSLYTSSANAVSSTVYEWTSSVTSYFNLRDQNEALNSRNAQLQKEILDLNARVEYLEEQLMADTLTLIDVLQHYDFIVAHVIKNSVMQPHNYITINKGRADGLRPEMGVIDQNGVVGVVNVVGEHSSRVISLLNPYFRLSCKIKGNDSFGSLVWDGVDPRYCVLEDLPRHTVFNVGDTVITNGYSAVFPPGLPVGVVESADNSKGENFFALKVKLLTDFSALDNVQVVVNFMADELKAIEEEEKKLEEAEKNN